MEEALRGASSSGKGSPGQFSPWLEESPAAAKCMFLVQGNVLLLLEEVGAEKEKREAEKEKVERTEMEEGQVQ